MFSAVVIVWSYHLPADFRQISRCSHRQLQTHSKVNLNSDQLLLSAQQVADRAALWRKLQNTVNFIRSDMKGAAAALYSGRYSEPRYQHRTETSIRLTDFYTTIHSLVFSLRARAGRNQSTVT